MPSSLGALPAFALYTTSYISYAVISGNSICYGYWNESMSDRSASGGYGKNAAWRASAFCLIVSARALGI